jgi:hypothetical protein
MLNVLACPRRLFVLQRALLGLYVCAHFALLAPYAAELFSHTGMLGHESPLLHVFPNVLAYCDSPTFVTGFVVFGAGAGLCLASGTWPRVAALVAYYVWACAFGRNPLIANPSLPFVGLMLLTCAVVGTPHDKSDQALARITRLLWIVMAVAYSYSGFTKLASASWQDGSALSAVLQGALARPSGLRSMLLALDPHWLCVASYGALLLEVAFAPLALLPRLRPWLWFALLLMHLALLALVQFADLSMAMMVVHAFTFDPRWVLGWSRGMQPSQESRRLRPVLGDVHTIDGLPQSGDPAPGARRHSP